MSGHAILGINVGKGQVAVKGQPATNEFGLASALYATPAGQREQRPRGGRAEGRCRRRTAAQVEDELSERESTSDSRGRLNVHPR